MGNHKFLIALFLALMALLFHGQYFPKGGEPDKARWTLSASEEVKFNEQTWKVGNYAYVGFSDEYLHFQLPLSGTAESERFFTVAPTYLDKVVVSFIDSDGAVINEAIKGDKFGDPTLSYTRDFSQFIFNVPAQAVSAQVVVASTSNLNTIVNQFSEDELFTSLILSLVVQGAFFTFLAGTIAVTGLFWWSGRSNIKIIKWFTAYTLTWMAFALGFSNILVVLDTRLQGFSDSLFSWSVIWVAYFSKLFFYHMLRLLMNPNLLLRVIFISIVVGPLNFLLYLLGDENLALILNIFFLAITLVLMVVIIPFTKGKDHISNFILGKIRVPMILLLLTVLGSSASAIGQGYAYSLHYLPVTSTVGFIIYFLLIWFAIERRKNATSLLKRQALVAVNSQLNKQHHEQATLFAMLFHEIKTPLTNLKFILYRWTKKPEADAQINHISHVLKQVEVMHKLELEQADHSTEYVSVIDITNDNWRRQPDSANFQIQTKGDARVMANHFLLQTVIKNILDNAVKYSPDGRVKVLVYRSENTCYLRVQNEMSVSLGHDFSKVTEKYWRAGGAVVRGTGLGLWLVKQLCEQSSIVLDIALRHGRFSVTLEIPCTPL